ncbi:MAG: CHAT domain-containing protein [Bacteroidetes bacterium]|nr:CHAT domain-containing protein [Bacteroidota bacterium]
MNKRICIRLLLSGLFLSLIDQAIAQFDFPNSPSDSIIYRDCNRWVATAGESRWDSAIFYGNELASVSKKEFGEMSHGYAVASAYYLGYLYAAMGDDRKAYDYLKRGVDIFVAIGDTACFRYKNSVFYYGVTCYAVGANAEAEPYLIKSAAHYREANEIPTYAQATICLASIYLFKGEYAKAESLNLQMKEILDTMPKSGFVYYLLGSIYNNVSAIYAQTGNAKKALQYMQKSEAVEKTPQSGVNGSDYVAVVLNLADAYANCNYLDSALARCAQAEDSLALTKKSATYAKLLQEKAHIYQQRNNFREAIRLYQDFKLIADTLPVQPEEYEINLINLGMLYSKTKQYRKADSLFREQIGRLRQNGFGKSFEIQQSLAGLCANLIGMKRYKEASDSLMKLCHLTFRTLDRNFAGMSEAGQLHYRTVLDGFFDLLYTCMYSDKSIKDELVAEAFKLELQRKNLILNNQVRILNKVRNSTDSAMQNLYHDWLTNRQILAKQYSLAVSQRIFNTDSLEYLGEKYEKEISSKTRTSIFNDSDEPVARFFSHQDGSSANIEFVRYNYQSADGNSKPMYAAFIYRTEQATPIFINLCDEESLTHLMKDNRGAWIDQEQLTQKMYNAQNNGSKILYNLIWRPMEHYLDHVKNINYSSAGLINNIALHAVHDGRDYLLHRYTLHRYTSLLETNQSSFAYAVPKEVNIWGNMNYENANYTSNPINQSASSLVPQEMKMVAKTKNMSKGPLQSFDTTEISGIKKVFYRYRVSVNSFENEFATEENFKKAAASTSGILHISTHGFYAPLSDQKKLQHPFLNNADISPLFRCGLAFSGVNYYWIKGIPKSNHEDGILTGYEVAQLDLHNVELVTLSACETGLGDVTGNEGNLGLERAFKLAGAHHLLVSLWEVPAKQTAELLSLFYNNWLQGKAPAEALQMAEQTMQQKKYPAFFWAGFVLVE